MKRVTLLIALAALVVFAGCKKEKETNGVVLKASIEQNKGEGRTSLNPIVTPTGSTAEILWTAGDQILVNNGTSNAIFTLTGGAGTTEGTFVYNGDYAFDANNVAVYPETATLSGNTVSLTLPAAQTAAAGTFGNGANPMLGTFTGPNDLRFKSLCGVLGVSLTGDNVVITGIEIVSNAPTDKLNGMFEADCTAADPVLAATAGNTGTNHLMLNCNATLTTSETQEFYMVLPVGALANGFTMNVYNGGPDPIFSKSTQSTELAVEWNTVKVMSVVEVTVAGGGGDDHAYVDLGLPSGLLWATSNVGANAPEEYGDYFAWGETQPKVTYNWSTYQYCNGGDGWNTLTKYCNNSSYGYNGYTDNLTTLLPEDDAAAANWGNGWRMPTKEEFEELYNNTTVTWTQQNGVNGRLFTATNGNSLFLPVAGSRYDSSLYLAGSVGYYWSSSLYTDDPISAWSFGFNSDDYGYFMVSNYRSGGFTVRPVCSSRQN
jgi:hypothetical protein